MYALLAGLDAIKVGRATALLFVTDPMGAILCLVRAVTAVRDKARARATRHAPRACARIPAPPPPPAPRACVRAAPRAQRARVVIALLGL